MSDVTVQSQGIQRLLPRHHGLLSLVLTGNFSRGQMATMLGYTPENVSLVIDSPIFQMELARRRKDQERTENIAIRDGITMAKDRLNQTALAAVEKMEQTLLSADEKLSLDAADKILKYAFPRNAETRGASLVQQVVVLSDDKLRRLSEALSESGLTSGNHIVSTQEANAA
jgi:hypothetical protein